MSQRAARERSRCAWVGDDPEMIRYHDEEWGVPAHDDRHLFEMLTLEGAQAGLSWRTILHKRSGYRAAFADFDAARVSRFDARKWRRSFAIPASSAIDSRWSRPSRTRRPSSPCSVKRARSIVSCGRSSAAGRERTARSRCAQSLPARPSRMRSRRSSGSAASASWARRSCTRSCRHAASSTTTWRHASALARGRGRQRADARDHVVPWRATHPRPPPHRSAREHRARREHETTTAASLRRTTALHCRSRPQDAAPLLSASARRRRTRRPYAGSDHRSRNVPARPARSRRLAAFGLARPSPSGLFIPRRGV